MTQQSKLCQRALTQVPATAFHLTSQPCRSSPSTSCAASAVPTGSAACLTAKTPLRAQQRTRISPPSTCVKLALLAAQLGDARIGSGKLAEGGPRVARRPSSDFDANDSELGASSKSKEFGARCVRLAAFSANRVHQNSFVACRLGATHTPSSCRLQVGHLPAMAIRPPRPTFCRLGHQVCLRQ